MIIWNIFLFSLLSLFFLLPVGDVSHISNTLHKLCLEQLNFNSPEAEIYKALVCGKRLASGHLKETFITGGLIHLTVVSGAHLLFLERFWKHLPLPKFLKNQGLFIVLILYAFACHLYPPVMRALFSFFIFQFSRSLKLFWNAHFITLLSGILCLIYKPSWIYSFSLQLSLLACFLQNISISSIKKSFFIYIFILPVINRWQALHPLTVLINWAFTPLIGSLLFPLSFLSPFFPPVYMITDFLWLIVLQVLKVTNFFPSQSPLMKWFIPKEWMWLYVSFVCFFVFIINFLKKNLFLYPKRTYTDPV